jgi:hypothetical protein
MQILEVSRHGEGSPPVLNLGLMAIPETVELPDREKGVFGQPAEDHRLGLSGELAEPRGRDAAAPTLKTPAGPAASEFVKPGPSLLDIQDSFPLDTHCKMPPGSLRKKTDFTSLKGISPLDPSSPFHLRVGMPIFGRSWHLCPNRKQARQPAPVDPKPGSLSVRRRCGTPKENVSRLARLPQVHPRIRSREEHDYGYERRR